MIQFVEVDAQTIFNNMIIDFQKALNEVLYPGDERRIFIEQEAQLIVAIYNSINDTGRQNLLRYARDEVLDAIGERTDTARISAKKATTSLRFTLSAAQAVDVTITTGKRGTPDGVLFFATTKDIIIPAGQTYGDVLAEATETGVSHNGFTAGQINHLVDSIPYVASVANIDTSVGGTDAESDDAYRKRIREAPNKFSTAGPADAYAFWAKTADSNIGDVAVTSPAAGEVKITVLLNNGEIPSQSVLDAVNIICNDKKRRPLTDLVTVAAPTTSIYNIDLTYYISQERSTEETNIRSSIEDSEGAIDQYEAWQCEKLGRDINPDYLKYLMLNAGAYRIDITAPIFTEVDADVVAAIGTVNVVYGGML